VAKNGVKNLDKKKLFSIVIKTGTAALIVSIIAAVAACSSGTTTNSNVNPPDNSNSSQQGNPPGTEAPGVNGDARGGFGGVSGTIASISGKALSLTTQTGTSNVTLNDSTFVQKTVTGSTSDLATGKTVEVSGTADSSGNIAASSLLVRDQVQSSSTPNGGVQPSGTPNGFQGGSGNGNMPSGTPPSSQTSQNNGGFTFGQITAVNGNTLTVTISQGSITVTISSDTTILKTVSGSISDLSAGQTVTVRGSQDSNGNVMAVDISIQSK
jgi:hypothetical protein